MARYARKIQRQAMDDNRLKSIVQAEIYSATGSLLGSDGGGDLSDQRRRSMEAYLSEPYGTEVEGRSQVIDSVVHDTIEAALPSLLEIFTSTEDIVRFEPASPEDEAFAEQATDYVNYIFRADNDGFRILYNWFKDALLQKNGIVKVFWEVTDHTKRETFTGLTEEDVALILNEENVEAIEHNANEDGTQDLTVLVKSEQGRVRIVNVPPEEFLIARRAVTMEDAKFVSHRVRKSVSELIEEGYDPEVLERIPSYDEAEYNEERLARFQADDEWPVDANSLDPAMRHIWVYECYMWTDYDGDGIAELRKITVAGPGYDLLDNEPIDFMPFVDITPIPMPHKFFGMSLADETMDIQQIKSTILRQLLDNMYFVNNGRVVVNERVNLDDLLTNRPGGVVRTEGDLPVSGAWEPMVTQTIGSFAFPLLEYMDNLTGNRTGITKYTQGLDADSLNKTATGIDRIMGAAQKRQQLIARIFGSGIKALNKKILHLVINHQDKERMIRLRNEWVPMDPRSWNAEMDVEINVGLGHGTKEQQLFAMTQWGQMQERIVMAQGGLNGPLVSWKEVYGTGKTFLEAAGIKNTDFHIKDPEDPNAQPPPEPPPDPKMIEAQMKGQEAQGKQQLDAAELQQKDRHHTNEMQLRWAEAEAQWGIKGRELQLEGQKVELDGETKGGELALKRDEQASGEVGKNLQELEVTRQMAEQASGALTQWAELAQGLVERVEDMEQRMSAPKTVDVVRDSTGKVQGAKVTQAGVTTDVTLQ